MVLHDLKELGRFYVQTHCWYAEYCRMLYAELQKTDLAPKVRVRFADELTRASRVRDGYEQNLKLCDTYLKNAAPRAEVSRVA
jgi:hypothetical protein